MDALAAAGFAAACFPRLAAGFGAGLATVGASSFLGIHFASGMFRVKYNLSPKVCPNPQVPRADFLELGSDPEGTLSYCTCAQEAVSTKRRKKFGLSVAYKTIGTFLGGLDMGGARVHGQTAKAQNGCPTSPSFVKNSPASRWMQSWISSRA